MTKFITEKNELGEILNKCCTTLFENLHSLDIDKLDIEPFYKYYFKKCHLSRPYFTLETSARLLYNSITKVGKPLNEIVLMDYGAGMGTLYILAKMIGVKQVIYNDLMPEFYNPAKEIDKALGYKMDEYILGDVEATCMQLKNKNIVCDIITSRNVLEHVYNLGDFFNTFYKYQPTALIYSSTTANWRNPAAHIQHIFIHLKYAKANELNKRKIIEENIKGIKKEDAVKLAKALKIIGSKDWEAALELYKTNHVIPTTKKDYTNISDHTGNWCEHLLPFSKYRKLAPNYYLEFKPGFWDTHYKSKLKTLLGKSMNIATNLLGKSGVVTSSFVYIIATPKQ